MNSTIYWPNKTAADNKCKVLNKASSKRYKYVVEKVDKKHTIVEYYKSSSKKWVFITYVRYEANK